MTHAPFPHLARRLRPVVSPLLALVACSGGSGGGAAPGGYMPAAPLRDAAAPSDGAASGEDTPGSAEAADASYDAPELTIDDATRSNALVAQPLSDRTLGFAVAADGVAKPITWGLDLAWLSESNLRRGVAFMGSERVDLVRSSFMPTSPLVNGALSGDALQRTNERIAIIKSRLGANTRVLLNSDSPSYDPSLRNNAANWVALIDATVKKHVDAGLGVLGVAPLDEPDDPANGQGSMAYFREIATRLDQSPRFSALRISGGNTLSADQAIPWYDYLAARLDAGNTHQLAGSFDSFAAFFTRVRADGKHASDDELHNLVEALVGVEYGLESGIWWGTAERARGELVKASDGVRLGYAEHRPNWTAAAVYRGPDGRVQAFAGGSERQAVTTAYRFVSLDRDVYFDGHGPQRELTLTVPGGTGYQQGQTNAERVISIHFGDDVPPPIDGRYVLVNRKSGMVLDLTGSSAGAALAQAPYTGEEHQAWEVHPVDARVGGDFSYHALSSVSSGLSPDVRGFSLDDGGGVIAYASTSGANQQWFLDYVADNFFRVCSRHSAKCLDVADASSDSGAAVVQWGPNDGESQHWRFIPAGTPIDFTPPSAPASLRAKGDPASLLLRWSPSPEDDVAGYEILRASAPEGPFDTIARGLASTSFVDHGAPRGQPSYYAVRAVDHALNRSAASALATATPSGAPALIAALSFEGDLRDASPTLSHGASLGGVTFAPGRVGARALALDGTSGFVQLPPGLASQPALSVAAWVRWDGGAPWQRLFDFGSDTDHYLYLTPRSAGGNLLLALKNGGDEQALAAPVLAVGSWLHVAVTLDAPTARVYVNGQLAAESSAITLRPSELPMATGYLGRSQFQDPLFAGSIDELRVYNYALSELEIAALASP